MRNLNDCSTRRTFATTVGRTPNFRSISRRRSGRTGSFAGSGRSGPFKVTVTHVRDGRGHRCGYSRLPQDGPEEPIQSAQGRPEPSPFEDGNLLAEGEYFERRVGAAAQEDAGGGKDASTNDTTISRFNTP